MGHQPGVNLDGYIIKESLGGGGGTPELYIAEKGGVKIFLKDYGNQFKPKKDSCFERFIKYEDRLRATIQSFATNDPLLAKKAEDERKVLKKLVYKIYDFKHIHQVKTTSTGKKIEKDYYIQAFEFIEPRLDMKKYLAEFKLTPQDRFILANIFMSAIRYLHEAKIVHCDLKPENICLIKQGAIYNPKLIDFDKSFFDGDDLSWISPEQKEQGYSLGAAGSPGYFSPEHLKYETVTRASDIFTCGLILYEILSKTGHPYWDTKTPTSSEKEAKYQDNVLAHKAVRPQLYGSSGDAAKDKAIEDVLYRCLDLNPLARPTASEIRDILIFGKIVSGPVSGAEDKKLPKAPGPADIRIIKVKETGVPGSGTGGKTVAAAGSGTGGTGSVKPVSAVSKTKLVLTGPNGAVKRTGVSAVLGRLTLSQFGPDTQYLSDKQFAVVFEGNTWYVEPVPGIVNPTLLNGNPVKGRTVLHAGDTITIGNAAILPIKVSFI